MNPLTLQALTYRKLSPSARNDLPSPITKEAISVLEKDAKKKITKLTMKRLDPKDKALRDGNKMTTKTMLRQLKKKYNTEYDVARLNNDDNELCEFLLDFFCNSIDIQSHPRFSQISPEEPHRAKVHRILSNPRTHHLPYNEIVGNILDKFSREHLVIFYNNSFGTHLREEDVRIENNPRYISQTPVSGKVTTKRRRTKKRR